MPLPMVHLSVAYNSYLEQAKYYDVDKLISKEEVRLWNKHTLNWYNNFNSQSYYPIKYLTFEEISNFIILAANKCENFLLEPTLSV